MTARIEARRLSGCMDLCLSCSSAVKTFANLQVVGDEKYLAPRWVPPGGCTCTSLVQDPNCPLCSVPEGVFLCRPCGEMGDLAPTELVTITGRDETTGADRG